jgi:hypothetical protein
MPKSTAPKGYTIIPSIGEFSLDAYGHLSFAVGFSCENDPEPIPAMVLLAQADQMSDEEIEEASVEPRDCGDWLACVDFDRRGNYVGYHVVVNSDSGGFIDTMEHGVLTVEEARKQLPCLLEYWDDIGSEQLVQDGHWYTREEREGNLSAIKRWRDSLERALEDD